MIHITNQAKYGTSKTNTNPTAENEN